jgi:hypothetical protein
MERFVSLAIGAALAVGALASSAFAQSGGGLHVFFPNDCQQNVYKPRSITVACADANFRLTQIKWTSYGATSASGTARARIDTCDPNCVSGTFRTYPAKVSLSKVKQCGDVPQFTRLAVTFTGTRPKGFTRVETQTFPCADPPTG